MLGIFERLVIIVRNHTSGGKPAPQRISLPSDLFVSFQAEFRYRALTLGVDGVYPGSVLSVPVVETLGKKSVIVLADGTELPLELWPD